MKQTKEKLDKAPVMPQGTNEKVSSKDLKAELIIQIFKEEEEEKDNGFNDFSMKQIKNYFQAREQTDKIVKGLGHGDKKVETLSSASIIANLKQKIAQPHLPTLVEKPKDVPQLAKRISIEITDKQILDRLKNLFTNAFELTTDQLTEEFKDYIP